MKNSIFARLLFFILLLVLPLPGRAEETPSLTIGGLLSLSGGLEQFCEYMRQGAVLAASEESEIKVSLVIEDDRSVDKKASLSAAHKLITADSADVIFLWTLSTVSTITPLINQSKTPLIVGAYDERIPKAGSLVFGDIVNYQLVARDIASYFHSRGAKRVATVLASDDWSSSYEAPFKAEAQRLGMTFVSSDTIFPHETETRSIIANLKRNRVDAVLAPLFGASLTSFIRRAKELQLPSIISVGDGMFEGDIRMLGGFAEGVTAAQIWLESPELADKVQRRFGSSSDPLQLGLVASGYDLTRHLISAATHIHRTGGIISRETMHKTLQTFSSSGYLGEQMLGSAPGKAGERIVVVKNGRYTLAK
jgi:ABC-type branched-subunit amino acid transport system substrate-binding protein